MSINEIITILNTILANCTNSKIISIVSALFNAFDYVTKGAELYLLPYYKENNARFFIALTNKKSMENAICRLARDFINQYEDGATKFEYKGILAFHSGMIKVRKARAIDFSYSDIRVIDWTRYDIDEITTAAYFEQQSIIAAADDMPICWGITPTENNAAYDAITGEGHTVECKFIGGRLYRD